MRKIVLYELMSLDGAVDKPADYFEDDPEPGRPPAFDQAMEYNLLEVIGAQDAVLLGRHMYDEWSHYWPRVDPKDIPFAGFINNVRKYVVTSTSLSNTWPNAEAVRWPIADLLRDLKRQRGGDIGIHGSITLAQSLLEADLVDELRLVVGPVMGFKGRQLFTTVDQVRRLDLVSTTPTPSGTVLLDYRVRR